MKKLPIGIQTLSNIIEDNYAYVDKVSSDGTISFKRAYNKVNTGYTSKVDAAS